MPNFLQLIYKPQRNTNAFFIIPNGFPFHALHVHKAIFVIIMHTFYDWSTEVSQMGKFYVICFDVKTFKVTSIIYLKVIIV